MMSSIPSNESEVSYRTISKLYIALSLDEDFQKNQCNCRVQKMWVHSQSVEPLNEVEMKRGTVRNKRERDSSDILKSHNRWLIKSKCHPNWQVPAVCWIPLFTVAPNIWRQTPTAACISLVDETVGWNVQRIGLTHCLDDIPGKHYVLAYTRGCSVHSLRCASITIGPSGPLWSTN